MPVVQENGKKPKALEPAEGRTGTMPTMRPEIRWSLVTANIDAMFAMLAASSPGRGVDPGVVWDVALGACMDGARHGAYDPAQGTKFTSYVYGLAWARLRRARACGVGGPRGPTYREALETRPATAEVDDKDMTARALAVLDNVERRAVILRYWAGCEHVEIGKALEDLVPPLSNGSKRDKDGHRQLTIRVLARALGKMRKALT